MRLVVTGREGQVVRSLIERAPDTDVEVIALGRPELDLSGPSDAIVDAILQARPEVVVSTAAYTQVDKAESEPELAFAVNENGAKAVAQAAHQAGVPLIHLSTDYVFDGLKASPYVEEDPIGPTGVYGASKLAGERAVLAEHVDSVVLRTAWIYSPFGANFVKTMLRLASDLEEVAVVADQLGNPSSALDIADAIIAVASRLLAEPSPELRGIFHLAGSGEGSWADLAEQLFAASSARGGPAASVRRIGTADYPTPAKRPANSRLNCAKLEGTHGVRLPDWRSSLETVVSALVQTAR